MPKKKITDALIFEGIKNKKPSEVNAAVTYLYERCQNTVFKYVKDNHGNSQDAEDVIQEVVVLFMHLIWREKYVYQPETQISTFLYVLAKRNWLKKIKLQSKKMIVEKTFLENTLNEPATPLNQYLENENIQTAKKIFEKLDAHYQQILEAYYDLGLSMSEISRNLDISLSNAKVRKFRGMQALKDLMK